MMDTIKTNKVINRSGLFTNSDELDPMAKFNIWPVDELDRIEDRGTCPGCSRSRKYYCYTCYLVMDALKSKVPSVRLPVKVDIIKHAQEVDGKSTSSHAAVISPQDVRIFTFPDVPEYDPKKVILVFPSKQCSDLEHLVQDLPAAAYQNFDLPFERVVFIDSTWRQTKKILSDKTIASLPCVRLDTHKSLFWRHQRGKSLTYLATIEAIYYFCVDLHNLMVKMSSSQEAVDLLKPYSGEYDNLLFFFKHTFINLRKKYNYHTHRVYLGNALTSCHP